MALLVLCSATFFATIIVLPATDTFRPCARWCVCSKTERKAECVGNGTQLNYIPRLPDYVTRLVFERNYLPRITNRTFLNITGLRITWLSLAYNNIQFVSRNSFSVLRELKDLEVGGNPLSLNTLTTLLNEISHLALRYLSLKELNLTSTKVLHRLQSHSLWNLTLERNYLTIYNQSDFVHLSNLALLYLPHNLIKHVNLLHSNSLNFISLVDNFISSFPNFCEQGRPYFPYLDEVKLDHNSIYRIPDTHFRCLKYLKTFSMNSNPVLAMETNTFADLPRLQNVILRNLKGSVRISRYAFNNSNIKYISVSSDIDFKTMVDKDAFKGLNNIKSLDVSHNVFYQCSQHNLQDLFAYLTTLTGLGMADCHLREFPRFIYKSLKNLQYLKLYDNVIKDLPVGAFKNLVSLTHLWMTNNHIARIKEHVFPMEVRQRLQAVSLMYNPFACNCELLWFLNWTKYDRNKFVGFPESYICDSPATMKHKELISVHLKESECLVSLAASIAIAWSIGFMLLFLVIFSLAVRWKWKVRYLVFQYRNRKYKRLENHELKYDAYVIYSVQDIKWIKNELIPKVEEEFGIKLYIRDRDSLAGDPKVDNVVNNMASSRTCLVILSNSMATNEECLFELMFAQRHINTVRHFCIVPVLFQEVMARNVTGSIYALVKMNSYISWAEDQDARDLFWNRLQRELESEQRED